ncbi:hypothetical protein GQ54DRAFT_41505 [Martensiomyces pterosporus]|nr:hypothetical protein GQ54DRAFT_41505 [Martensiomyces pterosporus]
MKMVVLEGLLCGGGGFLFSGRSLCVFATQGPVQIVSANNRDASADEKQRHGEEEHIGWGHLGLCAVVVLGLDHAKLVENINESRRAAGKNAGGCLDNLVYNRFAHGLKSCIYSSG